MTGLWRAFLRLFFRLLYNEFAWAYDAVAWVVSLGRWEAWGRTAIPRLCACARGRRVLELAHGPGHLLGAMVERGLAPVGLDLSPHMGRIARRRLLRRGDRVPLARARAQALPFRDASFGGAVSTFPAEFILDSATLREVARVLPPGGCLVIVAWARPDEGGVLSRFIGWLYRITGQDEPLPRAGEAEAMRAGLVPRVEMDRVGSSEVMLIVAERRR